MTTTGTVLTAVSGLATFGAASTGLRAAWLWHRASLVQVSPIWGATGWEPADPVQSQQGWTGGILQAAKESGVLNATAARWTAAAVILAAVQSAAGFLASALA